MKKGSMRDEDVVALLKQQLSSARAELSNLKARGQTAMLALKELRDQTKDIPTKDKIQMVLRIMNRMRDEADRD